MSNLDLDEAIKAATAAVWDGAVDAQEHPITRAVTAAAPIIERLVRERIAEDIGLMTFDSRCAGTLDAAVRMAKGHGL